jgi:hypothetical protein
VIGGASYPVASTTQAGCPLGDPGPLLGSVIERHFPEQHKLHQYLLLRLHLAIDSFQFKIKNPKSKIP